MSFVHEADASESNEILYLELKHGSLGYAFYFKVLELLARSENYKIELNRVNKCYLSYKCDCSANQVEKLIKDSVDAGAFKTEDGYLFSDKVIIRKSLSGTPQIRQIDRIISEKYAPVIKAELENRPDLVERLGIYYDRFLAWASLERVNHEADIEEEVKDYFDNNKHNNRFHKTTPNEWKKLRKAVFERDNYTCVYCGKSSKTKLHIDHIIPFSKGGGETMDNLTTACYKCNIQKGDKSVEEFYNWREVKYGTTN